MDQVRGGRQLGKWWRPPLAALGEPAPLAALSALALLASFPPLGFWPLAWVALAPLTAALSGRNSDTTREPHGGTPAGAGPGGRFRHEPAVRRWVGAGWGFGAIFYLGQFSWLGFTLVEQGGVAPLRALAFSLILVAALACVPALAFGAVAALGRWGWPAGLTLPLALGAAELGLGAWPFGGVVWGSLAGPQAHTLAAGLVLPVLGSAGLVALLGGVNSAWAAWAVRWRAEYAMAPPGASAEVPAQAPARSAAGASAGSAAGRLSRRHSVATAAAGVLLGIGTLALLTPWRGALWARASDSQGQMREMREMRALLVPGQLSLRELRAGEGSAASLRFYLARTLSALPLPGARSANPAPGAAAGNPNPNVAPDRNPAPLDAPSAGARETLVIWPESAAMEPLTRGRTLADLSRLGTLLDADFLLGADAEDPGRVTNALFLVTGGRFDFTRYEKRHLVPFGEYVPAGFGWAFGRKITAGEQDYAAGTQPAALDWRGTRLGVAVCFESILPGHVRDAVRAGAEVLVVAANEAWLPAYAQAQHVQLTALRAREVGREALFVSNGGPTVHLAQGSARAQVGPEGPPLAVRARRERGWTPWTRWGPWGDGVCWVALLLAGAPWYRLRGTRSTIQTLP